MAFELLPEELWTEIAPLLPEPKAKPKGGRPPISNRAALLGIVFILRTGAAWRMLPKELGCGSGVSCWRRLRDWTRLGVWTQVHNRLLNALHKAGQIDLSLAVIDSQSVRAVFGGPTRVRTRPTERKTAANAMS